MPVVRAGALTVVAATGLLALASTGQTPTGFVPAALGGPMGVFKAPAEESMADVLAIGDGPADASELADLLKTVGPSPLPTGPALPGVAAAGPLAAGAPPLAPVVAASGPTSAPVQKQSAVNIKPVLDGKGRIDCSQAVSCETDPATNITTVTYSDGVVAVVQKINDLTLVAYKTVGDVISGSIDALLPHATAALPAAASPPKPVVAPTPEVAVKPQVPEVAVKPQIPEVAVKPQVPSVLAGPVSPSAPSAGPELSASDVRPQLTITKPPQDFDAPTTGGSSSDGPKLPVGALDTVKEAVGSVVGAIGKAIGPGASTTEPGETAGDNAGAASEDGSS